MPFTWQININSVPGAAGGYSYDPNPLNQVATGDQIIWTNNDDKPHWPAIPGNQTYFMTNQIAPHSPSATFVPGVDGTVTYVDWLDQTGPTGTINVGKTTSKNSVVSIVLLLLSLLSPVAARAQGQQVVPCPAQQQSLITVPEVRSANGKLRATLKMVDGVRTLWGFTGDTRCATQNLRLLQGFTADNPKAWPTGPEPIPGPTFRARVGDLVEISFFNQVNVNNFASALDRGEVGSFPACDQYTTSTSSNTSKNKYGAKGDAMPNCLHGSSTTNVHFHGTHTTPGTTGDNVLLFIRPAQRENGQLQPSEAQTNPIFAQFFKQCEQTGAPKIWDDMPPQWQTLQRHLIQHYDSTAPYQGTPGTLPLNSQLWQVNAIELKQGLWPQYAVGASPYCFPLPKYDPATMHMGQAPGTHWYHAHKHGSTALNVANGLAGAFIIEGQYDDDLQRYYGGNLAQQVMVLQQLATAPFAVTNPNTGGPGSAPRPQISVNGRLNPVVAMRPGEVQMWRIVNAAWRDAVEFVYFQPQSTTAPCATVQPVVPSPVQWRQIAQDGVQFNVANYRGFGGLNNAFNLAPANRADLLVKAPTQSGAYSLCVVKNTALIVQTTSPVFPDKPSVLLTVNVNGAQASMSFVPDSQFPTFPAFLSDIQDSEILNRRELTFGAGFNTINGASFQDHHVDQAILANTAEEWVIKNEANDKSHPFHIHINPFQILELFEPNSREATTPGNPCYVDPTNPATFKPCATRQPSAPWVWWDTFAIPTGQQIALTCTTLAACPAPIQPYTKCTGGTCTEYIPGWFRMRSRFVDWTGQYVLHCHILIHEDRGMMQLVEVVSDQSPYSHH